jgi:hypothetical protein
MSDKYLCPVCGYPELRDQPWENDAPSDEICPSCGTHFGYDDVAGGDAGRREQVWRERRAEWKTLGMPWFSKGQPRPSDWRPQEQLAVVDES